MSADIAAVAAALVGGGAAVIPTDTVYGLAAAPAHALALFELKGRPSEKAIPVLAADGAQLADVVTIDAAAAALAHDLWPGPLTLVLPRNPDFGADLGGDDPSTVAVRVPAHPVALELLRATGPLAVTSANLSGEPPSTTLAEAQSVFGERVDAYLDGGACDGEPSTVL
nr:L-threonylcarbamoyladenylate synthase [Actinomycetota bacterium]